jgi:hypothetical protein
MQTSKQLTRGLLPPAHLWLSLITDYSYQAQFKFIADVFGSLVVLHIKEMANKQCRAVCFEGDAEGRKDRGISLRSPLTLFLRGFQFLRTCRVQQQPLT